MNALRRLWRWFLQLDRPQNQISWSADDEVIGPIDYDLAAARARGILPW